MYRVSNNKTCYVCRFTISAGTYSYGNYTEAVDFGVHGAGSREENWSGVMCAPNRVRVVANGMTASITYSASYTMGLDNVYRLYI